MTTDFATRGFRSSRYAESKASGTSGKLKYVPVQNGTGAAYSSFLFEVQDNGGTLNGGLNTDSVARKMTIAVV